VIVYMPNLFSSAPVASRNIALMVGGLCMVLGIIPAIFCKERIIPTVKDAKVTIQGFSAKMKEFFGGIAQTFKYKQFVKLCSATFLIFNGYQVVSQFAFFIIVYYLFNGDQAAAGLWPAWFGTVASLATLFLVIPVVTLISQKFGKKNAFVFSTAVSVIGYGLKWWGYNPHYPFLMLIPLPLISFGIGGLFTLMMSMTADVCDLDELAINKRREGTFGAVYWWMVKLGNGLAMFFSGAVLKWAGFDEKLGAQTHGTIIRLRLADIFIPAVTAILAVIIMWKYKLTEKEAREIRTKLEERRGKVTGEV
jgi:glycoside/pentoside/hexuronide:cation symporter, GPH family